jgi:hypothetical protein
MKYLIVFVLIFSAALSAMQSSQQMPQEIATFNKSNRWIDIDTDERAKDDFLNNALFEISDNDANEDIAAFLMGKGADPNFEKMKRFRAWTPLENAIRSDAVKIAWQMSNRGADCVHGLRILMDHACLTFQEDLFKAQRALFEQFLKKLKEKNKSVDEPSLTDRTALFNITQIKFRPQSVRIPINVPIEYRASYIKDLIAAGADPDRKNTYYGGSALDQARKNNLHELIPILCKK